MILSDGWCCYDCVTESDQCAAAARRCIQLLLPGTQGCFTETLRLQLELWNFRYLLIYINAVLHLSLRRPWAFSEDLSIIGSFPTVQSERSLDGTRPMREDHPIPSDQSRVAGLWAAAASPTSPGPAAAGWTNTSPWSSSGLTSSGLSRWEKLINSRWSF